MEHGLIHPILPILMMPSSIEKIGENALRMERMRRIGEDRAVESDLILPILTILGEDSEERRRMRREGWGLGASSSHTPHLPMSGEGWED